MSDGEEMKPSDLILNTISEVIQKIELDDKEGLEKIQVHTRKEMMDLQLASVKFMLLE
jgi:hypothetical protein